MIVLHSVSKEVGRGRFRRTIIDSLSWKIPWRSRIVVLGHRAGVSILLNIIAGLSQPTAGWVERKATISMPRGFLRYAGSGTTRQLIERLSPLFNADPHEVADFIEDALKDRRVLDAHVRLLPLVLKRQLNAALTYALPCEFYLFDGAIVAGRDPAFRAFCQKAFSMRCQEAGTIVALQASHLALSLGGNSKGAILYKGKFTLYDQLTDAIAVFDSLQPEEDIPNQALIEQEEEPEEEDVV